MHTGTEALRAYRTRCRAPTAEEDCRPQKSLPPAHHCDCAAWCSSETTVHTLSATWCGLSRARHTLESASCYGARYSARKQSLAEWPLLQVIPDPKSSRTFLQVEGKQSALQADPAQHAAHVRPEPAAQYITRCHDPLHLLTSARPDVHRWRRCYRACRTGFRGWRPTLWPASTASAAG